jgi:flagellar hook-associated protein FlgK
MSFMEDLKQKMEEKNLTPSSVNLYIRNTEPDTPPAGVSFTTNNIDSKQYQNYVSGGALDSSYGLATTITPAEQAELNKLQTQLDALSQQITDLTNEFQGGSDNTASQMQQNVAGVGEYLKELNAINQKISNFGSENTGINNIIKDSDIVVLQKNYSYLFWSTLAVGSVIVAMKLSK